MILYCIYKILRKERKIPAGVNFCMNSGNSLGLGGLIYTFDHERRRFNRLFHIRFYGSKAYQILLDDNK